MITSAKNVQVRGVIDLNKKARVRREEGLFAAEGVKMLREAPAGWIRKVYYSGELAEDPFFTELLGQKDCPSEAVEPGVFGRMCDTVTPQGVLTVLRTPLWTTDDILARENPLIVILEDLQDPGNLGTILRTGEAAGISGVVLAGNTVDITNPKVVRATMGSIYRVPFVYSEDVPSALQSLSERGIRSCAAHLGGTRAYDQVDYTRGTAFLIGNESKGLSREASDAADFLVRIPMEGQVESLNAAMASGILLYEAARQRRVSRE